MALNKFSYLIELLTLVHGHVPHKFVGNSPNCDYISTLNRQSLTARGLA